MITLAIWQFVLALFIACLVGSGAGILVASLCCVAGRAERVMELRGERPSGWNDPSQIKGRLTGREGI